MFGVSKNAFIWIVGVTAFSILVSATITLVWYEIDTNVTRADVLSVAILIPLLCGPVCTYLGMKSREKIEQLARENERLANTDALTGLANRRAFFHHLATQFEERVAAEHPVTFIICDVDNFKLFNDSFGHATGDAVLSHVAVVIEQVLPRRAFTARIGGEEFAIRYDSRCEDSDPDDVAQRLVKAVADTPLILNGAEHRITLSVGAFVGSNHTSPEQALSSADQAMYAAKSNGRNQFVRAA